MFVPKVETELHAPWSWLGPVYYPLNDMALGIINRMHIAQKFEALLEIYRRPGGRKWSGQEIDEATGGVVSRSYVTNLRKGRLGIVRQFRDQHVGPIE